MPTGLYSYYIRCEYKAVGGWVNWNFVRLSPTGNAEIVGTHLKATPFRTYDEAEREAFNLVTRHHDLIGLLKVEGKAV